MELPLESWYKSIFERNSRRRYTGESLEEDILQRLEFVCENYNPIPGARSVLVRSPPDGVYKGAIGTYGAVKGAPHFIAFIGDMKAPHVQEAIGYQGEGIILEATSQGLGTCWIAGFYRPEIVEQVIDITNNEQVLAITPIGHVFESKTRMEQTMTRLIGAQQRKELSQILILGSEQPSGWILRAIDAARLAPSAINRQPWRFMVKNGIVSISAKTNGSQKISPRLDCGIAMQHFSLGAKKYGANGKWELLNEPARIAEYSLSNSVQEL